MSVAMILILVIAMARSGAGQVGLSGEAVSAGPTAAGTAAPGVRNQLIIDSQEGRRGRVESGLSMHYNRVDGLYVQLGLDTDWKRPALLRFFARGGYAFKGEAWRYEVGLERWIPLGPA